MLEHVQVACQVSINWRERGSRGDAALPDSEWNLLPLLSWPWINCSDILQPPSLPCSKGFTALDARDSLSISAISIWSSCLSEHARHHFLNLFRTIPPTHISPPLCVSRVLSVSSPSPLCLQRRWRWREVRCFNIWLSRSALSVRGGAGQLTKQPLTLRYKPRGRFNLTELLQLHKQHGRLSFSVKVLKKNKDVSSGV